MARWNALAPPRERQIGDSKIQSAEAAWIEKGEVEPRWISSLYERSGSDGGWSTEFFYWRAKPLQALDRCCSSTSIDVSYIELRKF